MSLPRFIRNLYIILIFCLAGCREDSINPDISFAVFPDYGDTTTVFHFDARNLSAANLHVEGIRVRWDWESDSIWDTELSLDKEYARRYDKPGFYVITMEAVDYHGNRILKTDTIRVLWTDVETGQFTDDRDGQVYGMVKLGGRWIMTENLRYGTRIADTVYPSQSIGPEYYLYKNNPDNLSWGGLYTWYETMNYRQQEAGQGICPNGWHVPTLEEWNDLIGWGPYSIYTPILLVPVNIPFYYGPDSPTRLNVTFYGQGSFPWPAEDARASFSGFNRSVGYWSSHRLLRTYYDTVYRLWAVLVYLDTYSFGTRFEFVDWLAYLGKSQTPIGLGYVRCIKNPAQ